jgi:hypothetical protein
MMQSIHIDHKVPQVLKSPSDPHYHRQLRYSWLLVEHYRLQHIGKSVPHHRQKHIGSCSGFGGGSGGNSHSGIRSSTSNAPRATSVRLIVTA